MSWLNDDYMNHQPDTILPPILESQSSLVFNSAELLNHNDMYSNTNNNYTYNTDDVDVYNNKKRMRQITDDNFNNINNGLNTDKVDIDYTHYTKYDGTSPHNYTYQHNSIVASDNTPYVEHSVNTNHNDGNTMKQRTVSQPNNITMPVSPLPPLPITTTTSSPSSSSHTSSVLTSTTGNNKGFEKKLKHQQTDRQRRQKIKDGMNSLRDLVVPNTGNKYDQAGLVHASVVHISKLNDELNELRDRIKQLELDKQQSTNTTALQCRTSNYTSLCNPLSTLLPVLNAAGVSLMRIALDGRVLEVNMVFEILTGYKNHELVGRTPCHAPLCCALSVVPPQFLNIFNDTTTAPSHAWSDKFGVNDTNNIPSDIYNNTNHPPSSTITPAEQWNSRYMPGLNDECTLTVDNDSSSVLSDTKSSHTVSVNNDELDVTSDVAPHYLLQHLQSLPPNHVLKLMNTCRTRDGGQYEYVASMTLIRQSNGLPDYLLSVSAPDSRRVIPPPPPTNTNLVQLNCYI